MIVVGGRNSANTSRLVSLSREAGKPTYHVEVVDEISSEWFNGARTVGVTAGASTPGWVIEAVVKRLQSLGNG
jgi:4-hydroxy-3-methylbut-2-enyl diphosphate reductase